ncbi:Fur family transcriptional regulator, zinc uptake regulator [Lentibacillus persicus]|uniref:Fur family transcriptional regulator, zinc uptake regulator n=1 Tax=Lentibacillus persicus TaxID=640948 RepID=A0A1I1WJE6_9BACI|nr:Fur family transcriptional regulator [Lentibacillus persicus]SFD95266.1 Fur family transcriptional regulator, zinc uptake regulator [Lentibacillus persicus]
MELNEAIRQIKDKGYKTTAKRKDILMFFAEANGYRTAKDLIAYLESLYEGISFDTVYRNLHLFHEVGVLETTELNGEKHFRFSCTPYHHHHFICNDCGKTKELEICPMEEVQRSLGNYAIQDHKFEIYGLCPACQ